MGTPLLSKTPEHRARELMNLVAMAGRCAALPQADEAERRWWGAEVRRAMDELHSLAGVDAGAGLATSGR